MAKVDSNRLLFRTILCGAIALLTVSIIILASVPPVSRDALTHHLAVPKLYLKNGGIYEIPALVFSYYPMNLDFLYMIPLYFGNDIIPKYIHFVFAILTCWIIFGYLRCRINTDYALAGVLFFLSLPVIVKLSITVYVDLGLIFFSTAAFIHIFKWIENHFPIKYLLISSIWCGLALGTKYNGLIVLFLMTLFVPCIYLRKNKTAFLKAVGFGVFFMLSALLIFSPWAIKNYFWTKNPVFPLLPQVFTSQNTDLAPIPASDSFSEIEQSDKMPSLSTTPFAIRKIIYQETWWETLTIPIRIFFQGKDDDPKYFDGILNPYLFFLPIFAFFPKRESPKAIMLEKNVLLAFAVCFLLFSYFTADMRIRYVAPIIPPLVLLSIFGLHNIAITIKTFSGHIRLTVKGLVLAGIGALLCLNVIYVWQLFQRVDPISYISGEVSRDEYIQSFRPEYAAMKFASSTLPADARILCLFLGNRSYYSDREMIFGDTYFQKNVKMASTAEQMKMNLKRSNISHLLIYYHIFRQWSGRQLNNEEKAMLLDFFKAHAKLIFAKGGYGLYQL